MEILMAPLAILIMAVAFLFTVATGVLVYENGQAFLDAGGAIWPSILVVGICFAIVRAQLWLDSRKMAKNGE